MAEPYPVVPPAFREQIIAFFDAWDERIARGPSVPNFDPARWEQMAARRPDLLEAAERGPGLFLQTLKQFFEDHPEFVEEARRKMAERGDSAEDG